MDQTMPPLSYLGKDAFRKHIQRSVIIQVVLGAFIFLLLRTLSIHIHGISTIVLIVLFGILEAISLIVVFDTKLYKQRFSEVFPGRKLNTAYYIFLMFLPVCFWMLTIYLYLKEKGTEKYLKFRYVAIFSICLLSLQLYFPKVAYFTGSPSIYFFVDTFHDAMKLIDYKESLKSSENAMMAYMKKNSDNLTSTEFILLFAVAASETIKDKNRAIASGADKKEAAFKYALQLLKFSHQGLEASERQSFSFFDFSPLHWLHPSGAIEILILTGVENDIKRQFHKTIITKNMSIISTFEKKLDRLPAGTKVKYQKQLAQMRLQLESTETFKSQISKR